MAAIGSDASASFDHQITMVDLALQSGGSHGAFTWGVLDRLLEEPWLRIDGISGTSAGAMNAVVLTSGYEAGRTRRRTLHLKSSGGAFRILLILILFGEVPWIFC